MRFFDWPVRSVADWVISIIEPRKPRKPYHKPAFRYQKNAMRPSPCDSVRKA